MFSLSSEVLWGAKSGNLLSKDCLFNHNFGVETIKTTLFFLSFFLYEWEFRWFVGLNSKRLQLCFLIQVEFV